MKAKITHKWQVSYHEAIQLQSELACSVSLKDECPTQIDLIGGCDVSYAKADRRLYASVVVFSYPDLSLVQESSSCCRERFPYIPGLLTFREAPALLKAFEKLNVQPDVALFDGQGIAHPRGLGLASHMGVLLDIPTIGCAKSRLVGEYDEPGGDVGNYSELSYNGQQVGAVVRTRIGVKPVFVSPGHKITLKRALQIILEVCRGYRLPEPVRQAHLAVNRLRCSASSRGH